MLRGPEQGIADKFLFVPPAMSCKSGAMIFKWVVIFRTVVVLLDASSRIYSDSS